MKEEWKDIKGFEGVYKVSNTGYIKRLSYSYNNQYGGIINKKEKILKPILSKHDNQYVLQLQNKHKIKRIIIKNIVAYYFLEKPVNQKALYVEIINKEDFMNFSVNNIRYIKYNNSLEKIAYFKNENKIVLLSDLRNKGVYKIVNTVNNKFYIGSSRNMYNRLAVHFYLLRKNNHYNSFLQKSYNKYGEGSFSIEIVEKCLNTLEREQYYIDLLKPEYNLTNKAVGGLIEHSEESKNKMSIIQKKRYEELPEEEKIKMRERLKKAKEEYVYTDEHKKSISKGLRKSQKRKDWYNKNKKRIIEKISESNKINYSKKVYQYTKDFIFIQEFYSITEACKHLNITNGSSISRCCRDLRKTASGYIWRFKKI